MIVINLKGLEKTTMNVGWDMYAGRDTNRTSTNYMSVAFSREPTLSVKHELLYVCRFVFVCSKGRYFFVLIQTCIIYDNVVTTCLCFEKENALFKIL